MKVGLWVGIVLGFVGLLSGSLILQCLSFALCLGIFFDLTVPRKPRKP